MRKQNRKTSSNREEFKGVERREIGAYAGGAQITVYATAAWLRIGGLVSVAAHYHDHRGPGGTAMAMVHGRTSGLLHNSVTGQAVQVQSVMGKDHHPWTATSGAEATATEAAIRYAFKALEDMLTKPYRLKSEARHPWLIAAEAECAASNEK